jgi:PAS domain S-box-containing protein
MKKKNAKTDKYKKLRAKPFDKLRTRAEAKLKKTIVKLRKEHSGDLEKTIHELGVYQIELEMQNEELRAAQQELETSRNKYSDLYDFAPVGYFTFDKNGVVIEANLTGCRMLGVERNALIKKPFRVFVDKDSQDEFYLHRQNVSISNTKQSCEITLARKDKTTLDVLFESIPAVSADGKVALCRTAMTDITERKDLERLKEAISQQAIEERNRLEAVMEALPTGMAIVDEKGGNVVSNAAYEQVWGGPRPPISSI